MNAITRTATHGFGLARPFYLVLPLPGVKALILLLVLLINALGVVYCKDLNRRLFINYQNLQQGYNQLNIEHSELLLEQSAWSNQAHVQMVAERQLGMQLPSKTNVIVITA